MFLANILSSFLASGAEQESWAGCEGEEEFGMWWEMNVIVHYSNPPDAMCRSLELTYAGNTNDCPAVE
jgi:hypothetical protein